MRPFTSPASGSRMQASSDCSHRADGSARWAGPCNPPNTPPLRLRPAEHQAIHAAAHVPKVGFVAALELGNGAPRVANFAKGRAHGLPVHVAIPKVHPLVSILFALEVFQVNLDDALPQRANPVLRIAVK